jgi:hypothetical protein
MRYALCPNLLELFDPDLSIETSGFVLQRDLQVWEFP